MKITDEQIRDCISQGMSQQEIALSFRLSPQAVSKRVARLEAKALARSPRNAAKVVASVWDVKAAAEENYARAIEVLADCESGGEKVRAIGEVRQHLQFAMQVIEALYNAQETQAFMEEVLSVVDECEPGSKERILSRLRERRAIRAAFLPH